MSIKFFYNLCFRLLYKEFYKSLKFNKNVPSNYQNCQAQVQVRKWAGSGQEMPGYCQEMVQNGQKIGPRWPGNGPGGRDFVRIIQEMI